MDAKTMVDIRDKAWAARKGDDADRDLAGLAAVVAAAKAEAVMEFARTITIRSPYGHEVTESMARIQVNNQAWDRAAEYRNTTESEGAR